MIPTFCGSTGMACQEPRNMTIVRMVVDPAEP
jgi:hypothetical protein